VASRTLGRLQRDLPLGRQEAWQVRLPSALRAVAGEPWPLTVRGPERSRPSTRRLITHGGSRRWGSAKSGTGAARAAASLPARQHM
jgi:hypothetical protein